MTDPVVIYEELDGVALIRFNRPASRNAWNVPLTRAVIAAVRQANASPSVGAMVITGEGEVYSAGSDFKAPPEPEDENGRSPHPASLTMGQGDDNWLKLLIESKPVVVAVNGPAIGLGATHTLAADIRVAAETASFSFPFLRLGAMPECAASALLGRLVGFGRAMDLCLRARQIDAEEALRIGLVTEVFPANALLDGALAIARTVASYPALQMRMSKRLMWDNARLFDPDEIMRAESVAFIQMLKAVGRSRPLENNG